MEKSRDISAFLSDGVWLANKFSAYESAYPGLDKKGQGAFLIGEILYYAVAKLVLYHLQARDFPVEAARLKFTFPPIGEVKITFAHDTVFRPTDRKQRLKKIRDTTSELCEQIIPVLTREAKLGKAAQWRLAADSLASAFLYTGREQGREELAVRDARQILAMSDAPLSNSMTGFVDISVHHNGRDLSQTFITRGGCCRYYVCDEGSHCSTCILKNPQEKFAALQDEILDSMTT